MFNPTEVMIQSCINQLKASYRHTYGHTHCEYVDLLGWVASMALETIARSDAAYHDIEHTILVTLTGQEILRGKHLQDGTVTPHDWLHLMISLLCHDIGYVKGICQHDDPGDRRYSIGIGDDLVQLPVGATDASLTPYHVDRGQRFVEENLANQPLLDIEQIKRNIELTRFPALSATSHQDTAGYAGLARAADLIGQLSDPRYLQKIPSLFYEFEETGATQALGYRHPDDLRAGYPRFYNTVVLPYVKDGLRHLSATHEGRQIVAYLHTNLLDAERPPAFSAAA